MSNKIDSAHPFRASISHKPESQAAQAAPVTGQEAADLPKTTGALTLLDRANAEVNVDHREQVCLEQQAGNFKKKAKLLGGALVVVALFYLSLEISDALSRPDSAFEHAQSLQSSFDDSEYSGSRDVDEARRSVGIFARLFCKGGRRSTFCN